MEKVIIEITHPGGQPSEYRVLEKLPVTIGRGFQNDIILADPFVSASHLIVDKSENGWKIVEAGGENGVWVNKRHYLSEDFKIQPGVFMVCGQTKIRIFPGDYKPDKTRIFDRMPAFLQKLSRPLSSLMVAFILCLFIGFRFYLSTHEKKVIDKMIIVVLVFLIFNLFWTVIWSFVGRVLKHKNTFFAQLSVCCLFSLCALFFSEIGEYLSYLFSSWNFKFVFMVILWSSAIALLFYGNLSIATSMRRMQKIAFIMPVIILITALVIVTRLGKEEKLKPEFNSSLFMPSLTLVKGKPISEFMEECSEISTVNVEGRE